jgi:hypothetical protein
MVKKAKRLLVSLLVLGAVTTSANAEEIDIVLNGLSYHLDDTQGYVDSPTKLDDKAQWVLNAGLGITYDFRDSVDTNGLSVFTEASWFQDCSNTAFVYVGVGARYRHYITDRFMIEGNFAVAVANGAVYDDYTGLVTDERDTTLLPVANIGFGYKVTDKYLLKTNFTYVPENDDIGGTSGTNIIFMQISLGF